MKGGPAPRRRRSIAALSVLVLVGAACAEAPSETSDRFEPADVVTLDGSEIARIQLTEQGAERIGLETVAARRLGGHTVVPSSALILDPEGRYWVYATTEPLVFARQEVTVDREEAERAYLAGGLAAGTEVVVLGAQELWGAESGIGGH